MAVYQGARARHGALPAADSPSRSARVAAPATVGDGHRVRPMGLLMASIVVSTMLGLVYLTQTLGSNATNSEIGDLQTRGNELLTQIHRNETVALSVTQAEDIVPAARKQKLKRLGEPIVLPAP